jgi:hypothetical protein
VLKIYFISIQQFDLLPVITRPNTSNNQTSDILILYRRQCPLATD